MKLVSPNFFIVIIFLLVASASALANEPDDFDSWNRIRLLNATVRDVVEPGQATLSADDLESITSALSRRSVSCQISRLKKNASDDDLRVIWLLWGYGNGKNKIEVIRRFGEGEYHTAVEKFSNASFDCMVESMNLKERVLKMINES